MLDYEYFNLNYYEQTDLEQLLRCKKFDGLNRAKLNRIERFVCKSHKYGWNRMCPLMIGLFFGFPILMILGLVFSWIFLMNYDLSPDLYMGIIFGISIVVGVVWQLIYDNGCDKIDYNWLLEKNKQINMCEWLNKNILKDKD